MRSFLKVVVNDGDAEQPPTSKTSVSARFRGWWWIVVMQNNHQRRKRARLLVFKVGGNLVMSK
jgi:hypothetical protein